MTQHPSRQPLSQLVTQAVQKLVGLNGAKPAIKKGARVPELWVKESQDSKKVEKYPLLGDRYIIGRSSRTCDILIKNAVVSQTHCSLHRDPDHPNHFYLKDEDSTNGLFFGRKRLKTFPLRHGDVINLGPPELEDITQLIYRDPPPLWLKTLRYGLYGTAAISSLLIAWIGWEWTKFEVHPLPAGVVGPVVIYAKDGKTLLNPLKRENHHELKKLSDFSPYLPKAVIASEDSRFYWHFGIDPLGIVRAVLI
ncbi:MAG: FHA domain-containing protein, partial [Snowella sp.]